jgi:hypothetical protein
VKRPERGRNTKSLTSFIARKARHFHAQPFKKGKLFNTEASIRPAVNVTTFLIDFILPISNFAPLDSHEIRKF